MRSNFFNPSIFYLLLFSALASDLMLMHTVQALHWTRKRLMPFQAFVSLLLPWQHLNIPMNVSLQHICEGENTIIFTTLLPSCRNAEAQGEKGQKCQNDNFQWKLKERCGSFHMRSISLALSPLKAQAQLTSALSTSAFQAPGVSCWAPRKWGQALKREEIPEWCHHAYTWGGGRS